MSGPRPRACVERKRGSSVAGPPEEASGPTHEEAPLTYGRKVGLSPLSTPRGRSGLGREESLVSVALLEEVALPRPPASALRPTAPTPTPPGTGPRMGLHRRPTVPQTPVNPVDSGVLACRVNNFLGSNLRLSRSSPYSANTSPREEDKT